MKFHCLLTCSFKMEIAKHVSLNTLSPSPRRMVKCFSTWLWKNGGLLLLKSARQRRLLMLLPALDRNNASTFQLNVFMEDKRWSESLEDPLISGHDEFTILLDRAFCVHDWVWAEGWSVWGKEEFCDVDRMVRYAISTQPLSFSLRARLISIQ